MYQKTCKIIPMNPETVSGCVNGSQPTTIIVKNCISYGKCNKVSRIFNVQQDEHSLRVNNGLDVTSQVLRYICVSV